jgi:hypothetical protein
VLIRKGNFSIRFGKAPYPRPEDVDTLSRLALAYGVRRDMFEIRDAVSKRLNLPNDQGTSDAIIQVIGAVINAGRNNPQAIDQLADGKGLPEWAHNLAIGGVRNVAVYRKATELAESPKDLVDLVLSDFVAVLQKT